MSILHQHIQIVTDYAMTIGAALQYRSDAV